MRRFGYADSQMWDVPVENTSNSSFGFVITAVTCQERPFFPNHNRSFDMISCVHAHRDDLHGQTTQIPGSDQHTGFPIENTEEGRPPM